MPFRVYLDHGTYISEKHMDHGTYISATKLCSKLISVKLEVDDKNNKGKIAEWLL
jgi:hypothetical protein